MATRSKTSPKLSCPSGVEIKAQSTSTLPSSVRILGKEILIGHTKSSDMEEDDLGNFSEVNLSIYVKPDQLPIEEIDTVVHETIHGIDYILQLELTERQVRLLGTAFAGILQDNPEFAAFITRKVNR